VYAYWEISPASLRDARAGLGENYKKTTQTLRMFDITGIDFDGSNANGQFDIDLDPKTQSRYIILPNDNAIVCADLGLRTANGFFFPLARSNVIATPSANESDCMETTWVKVRHKAGSKPCVVARAFSESTEHAIPQQPGAVSAQSDKGESEAGPTPGMDADTLAADRGQGAGAAPHAVRINESVPGTPKGGVASKGAPSPAGVKDKFPSFCLSFAGASEKTFFSADVSQPSSFPAYGADRLPSSADFANVSSSPVGGSERLIRGKDFFFHLDADLIVYGKAQPGARVTLNEQPVALGKDGSFSVRFALPDGMLGLDFRSQPPDGSDKKNISLTVGRSTTVHP
jgi:hypothetical protein